jgi:hypothetical protein
MIISFICPKHYYTEDSYIMTRTAVVCSSSIKKEFLSYIWYITFSVCRSNNHNAIYISLEHSLTSILEDIKDILD